MASPDSPAADEPRTFLFRHRNPNPCVFVTRDIPIVNHLISQGCWRIKEIYCLPEDHPAVSNSCIIALSDGEIRIDEAFLSGNKYAKAIRDELREKLGIADPDVEFVGAFADSRTPSAEDTFIEKLERIIERKDA
jgi:hypothetical protein